MADTGAISPGSAANYVGAINRVDWSNPSNALASDDARATAFIFNNTDYLRLYNFGFDIPLSSTIDGIKVEIERSASSTAGSPKDLIVILSKDGTHDGLFSTANVSENKASASVWPTTDAYATYGGAADLWAFSSGNAPTPADINDADFSVMIAATETGVKTNVTVRVDHVRVTVYYTAASGKPSYAYAQQ